MGRMMERAQPIERGEITLLYRPRVERSAVASLSDVQRLLVRLAPEGSRYERVIAIGRKLLPRSGSAGRFWGFVDLLLAPSDMQAALGAQVYGTQTRGIRHLPAARPMASGSYSIEWHDDHGHLRWHVEREAGDDPIALETALEMDADYIVTVANPDPAAWGLQKPPDLQGELFDELEVHVTVPAPFPGALQSRFEGRRYAALDTVAWLNHPGAELVFIGAAREMALAKASGE